MNIAFFGGSFNPIHNGHLNIIHELLKEVDKVLIIPCGNHAFGKELLEGNKRIELIKLAIEQNNRIEVSDLEIKTNEKSYTANSLRKLRENSNDKYYLAIGADNIQNLDKWHNFSYLRDSTEFIIFKRPNYEANNLHNIKIKSIIDLNYNTSSSEIRQRIKENRSLEGLTPKPISDYIKQRGLYL